MSTEPNDDAESKNENNNQANSELDTIENVNEIEVKYDIKCEICNVDYCEFWRQVGKNIAVCNECFNSKKHLVLSNANKRILSSEKASSSFCGSIHIDNLSSSKSQTDTSEIDTSKLRRVPGYEAVIQNGFHIKVNDIVSIIDEADRNTYYAQIRGLFVDDHLNNMAVITWLLPTDLTQNDSGAFNLDSFLLGPDEDFPRPLDSLQFVCRPKTNYFKLKYHLFDKSV